MEGNAIGDSSAASDETPAEPNFPEIKEAIAVLHPTLGHEATGTVVFRSHPDGLELDVSVAGLPSETRHGFHIHQFGDCSDPEAKSAGAHYDPTGMMMDHARHGMKPLGDLDDLVADADGRVEIRFVARDLSLVGEKPILGRGLLLHESYDDPSDPLLVSGDPIACGTVGARQEGGPRS